MAAVRNGNTNYRRLPSKMGGRPQEVRAVGAWVQPAVLKEHRAQDAVLSAQIEGERLHDLRHQKERKLRQFQDEVRRRVVALDKLKKQELLEKSYRAVEVERSVVNQSAFAAEKTTPRKDRCTLRQDADLSIGQPSSHINIQSSNYISDGEYGDQKQFEQHSHQVHSFTKQARDKLTSRRVMVDHPIHSELPGGFWQQDMTSRVPHRDDAVESAVAVDSSASGTSRSTQSDLSSGQSASHQDLQSEAAQNEGQSRSVHFGHVISDSPEEEEGRKPIPRHRSADSSSRLGAQRAPLIPDIYPGVAGEEEKVRAQNQRAMYRRLFMDIEREQVKENLRQKEHAKKINKLKRAKEVERKLIEDQAHQLAEPKDPITGETPGESFKRELREEKRRIQTQQDRQLRVQKNRETERFLEALKVNLRDKIAQKNIELPALCCCGVTVWDTNPDTCANNCVFYKNPKAYVKALQSLLASCDVA